MASWLASLARRSFWMARKLVQSFFELPGESCAVLAKGVEGASLLSRRFDGHQGRLGLGMFGCDVVLVFGEAQGEQVIFERGDAVQSPGCVGEGLHQLLFEA